MHYIDYVVFAVYFFVVLYIGYHFFRKNKTKDDYFVGGRTIGAGHVGLSIAATDVGGGFSIGLGGLGFTMGLAGSWLLFTGLVGAWIAAIITVPRLKKLDLAHNLLTFPDFLSLKYGKSVGAAAAIISGIGYTGFTAGQMLAGGKLAAGSVFADISFTSPLFFSLILMAFVIIGYTVLGGLKAVIYTDTVQWIVLIAGLLFAGIPFAYVKVGGWDTISSVLPSSHFDITSISAITLINWAVTIIPIWFVAMTLYQRVFACKNVKQAQRAFFVAGLFEYPVMAFTGVILGMLARVAFPESDAETALPLLLRDVLPIGIAGLVLAAYFSAIMSTADSCLIAASGNLVNDIIDKLRIKKWSITQVMAISQWATAALGILAFLLAVWFTSVLEIVLQSYAFMVSGLLVPTLIAYFSKNTHSAATAAMVSMLSGGSTTLVLIFMAIHLPFGLSPTVFGIAVSFIMFFLTQIITKKR